MIRRPRRLRQHPAMRELVAETSLGASDLILPLFYADVNREIPSMPGVFQHDRDSMLWAVHDALDAGVRCVDVFGVPTDKDDIGSGAWDPEGILNRGVRALREEFGNDIMVMADTCLDEFTSHGHCHPTALPKNGGRSGGGWCTHCEPLGHDGWPSRGHQACA